MSVWQLAAAAVVVGIAMFEGMVVEERAMGSNRVEVVESRNAKLRNTLATSYY